MALVTIVTVQPQATEATLSLKYVASSYFSSLLFILSHNLTGQASNTSSSLGSNLIMCCLGTRNLGF